MMNKSLCLIILILGLLIVSCSEDFNFLTPDKKDVYSLNCILRSNSDIQYAIISKNIISDLGIQPEPNNLFESIVLDAKVKLNNGNKTFKMKDTTLLINHMEREALIHCYYCRGVDIMNKQLSIEANIPDGTRLKSLIQVPVVSFEYFDINIPANTNSIPLETYAKWKWNFNGIVKPNLLNIVKMEILYTQFNDDIYISKKCPIPLELKDSVITLQNALGIPNEFNYCKLDLKNINQAMLNISGNDPNKQNYIITDVIFTLSVLEPNLEKYYLSNKTFSEEYSIRISEESDISNIEGGYGFFGAISVNKEHPFIDKKYVESFGYRYEPKGKSY